jgi:hypothetical protein
MTEAEELELLELEELEAQAAGAKPKKPTRTGAAKALDAVGLHDMGEARAGVLGVAQGGTAGFADEIAAGAVSAWDRLRGKGVRPGAAASPELRTQLEATPSTGDLLKQRMRGEVAQAAQEHPETYIPGEVAGMVASSYAGGKLLEGAGKAIGPAGKGLEALAKWAKANPWKAVALAGGAQGAAYGAGSSEAEDATGVAADTALGGGLGALGGLAGKAIGTGLSKGTEKLRALAGRKVGQMTDKIDDLARAREAGPTASARSKAGTTATDAYKQAEHTLSLSPEKTTPEQVAAAKALLEERALKAAGKLEDSAAAKEAAKGAYQEALASEPARVADAAKEIGNPWTHIKPQLKRYALPIAGGVAGAVMGDGNPLGFAAGALAGRGVSPTVLALLRTARRPGVQRPLWKALEKTLGGAQVAGGAARSLAAPAQRALQLEIDDPLIQALAAALEKEEEGVPPEAMAGGR